MGRFIKISIILLMIGFLSTSCQKMVEVEGDESVMSSVRLVMKTSPESEVVITEGALIDGAHIRIEEEKGQDEKSPSGLQLVSPRFKVYLKIEDIPLRETKVFTDSLVIYTVVKKAPNLISRLNVILPDGEKITLYKPFTDTINYKVIPPVSLNFLKQSLLKNYTGQVVLEFEVVSYGSVLPQEPKSVYGKLYKINSANMSDWREVNSLENLNGKVPLILVHGWGPEPDLEFYYGDPRGCVNSHFGNFINYFFSRYDLRSRYQVYAFRYDRSVRINTAAQSLRDLINRCFYTRDSLVIVGYSMGGLVSRAYIINFGGSQRLKRLITLATPHNGSPLADLTYIPLIYVPILFWNEALYDLKYFDNPFIQSLNSRDYYTNKYRLYGGYIASSNHSLVYLIGDWLIGWVIGDYSDGVVGLTSARYKGSSYAIAYDYDHSEMVEDKGSRPLFSNVSSYLLSIPTNGKSSLSYRNEGFELKELVQALVE